MYSSAKYIAIVWILLLSFSRSSVAFIHRTSNSYLSINIHNDKKSTHNNIIHQSSLVCLAAAKKPWLITVDDWWKKKFKKRLWRREDSDPPSILEQVLIIATVASVITLFMSDPVQSVVNGEKFDEGYRYITMNGKLNELDESYRYSNCKRVARTKTNRDNIYYCQVDSGYIIENDGTVSLEVLAVSSTLLYLSVGVNNRMNDIDIDNDKKIEDEVDDQ